MSRRNKSDGVTPSALQFKHDIGQFPEADLTVQFRSGVLADLIILAEDAPKIAIRKEDIPNAVGANKERLLTEVWRAG
jgi:hypothetical protein